MTGRELIELIEQARVRAIPGREAAEYNSMARMVLKYQHRQSAGYRWPNPGRAPVRHSRRLAGAG